MTGFAVFKKVSRFAGKNKRGAPPFAFNASLKEKVRTSSGLLSLVEPNAEYAIPRDALSGGGFLPPGAVIAVAWSLAGLLLGPNYFFAFPISDIYISNLPGQEDYLLGRRRLM